MTHILEHYDKGLEYNDKTKVLHNILHTDNFTTQYKCFQNFIRVTTVSDVISKSKIIYKFDQKY